MQNLGGTYFGERVLFGCFFFADAAPGAGVVEVVDVGPVRVRSLAVRVAGISEAGRSEL
jgi:hypothetical protein